MSLLKRCGECNEKREIKSIKGRVMPYKDVKIPFPADLYYNCCKKCGEFWMTMKDAVIFDSYLEPEYQKMKEQKLQPDVSAPVLKENQQKRKEIPDIPPQWIKNENGDKFECYDGDIFVVALRVRDTKSGKSYWSVDKVRISCDEDYFEMHYADCADSTPYDGWAWEDFEYYMKVTI